jgi:FMN-dependent NADH-azoreductase
MTDNRKLLMIQASGSIYTNQDRYTALDISHLFIEGIFKEIMGFSNIDNLRIEGTALLNQKAILEKGKKELTTIMSTFYNN